MAFDIAALKATAETILNDVEVVATDADKVLALIEKVDELPGLNVIAKYVTDTQAVLNTVQEFLPDVQKVLESL